MDKFTEKLIEIYRNVQKYPETHRSLPTHLLLSNFENVKTILKKNSLL